MILVNQEGGRGRVFVRMQSLNTQILRVVSLNRFVAARADPPSHRQPAHETESTSCALPARTKIDSRESGRVAAAVFFVPAVPKAQSLNTEISRVVNPNPFVAARADPSHRHETEPDLLRPDGEDKN